MQVTPRSQARHKLAHAMGIQPQGGSWCVCCAQSPFDSAGAWARVLGAGFSEWDAFDAPTERDICAGCAALVSGKPGSDPPPIRMRTVAVIDDALHVVMHDQVWPILQAPPAGLTVLSWAVSKKKHHPLFAEICTPDRLRIGSDNDTIELRPERDAPLMVAVLALRAADDKDRAWFSRTEILSGHYSPTKISSRGAQRWADLEAIVAPHRGSMRLDLIVNHAPVLPPPPAEESALMLDPTDHQAVSLLYELARASQYRQTDGLSFWQSLFQRRVQRHAGRALPSFVSRLMSDLQIEPQSSGAQEAVSQVQTLDAEQSVLIMSRIRERTSLLIALAYDRQKAEVSKRKRTPKPEIDDLPQSAPKELFT